MTVNNPDRGNKTLTLVATSAAAGSTCPVGTATPLHHHVQVKVPQLTITSAADTSSTIPGSVVSYTFSVTNTGQTAYVGANLAARWPASWTTRPTTATPPPPAGAVGFASPTLTWTGDLAIGASVTVTYSVTVNDPDHGNQALTARVSSTTAGSNCAPAASTRAASPASRC